MLSPFARRRSTHVPAIVFLKGVPQRGADHRSHHGGRERATQAIRTLHKDLTIASVDLERHSLAGTYLSQAAELLRNSGSADALYGDRRLTESNPQARGLLQLLARPRRLEFARTSILLSAMAAEAYVNAFIYAQRFSKRDRDGLDKLGMVDKHLFVPRILGHDPFRRDREPITSLQQLTELRNLLVHPKPRPAPKKKEHFPEEPDGFERFNPEVAAKIIVAVATAALELTGPPFGEPDQTALIYWSGRGKVRAFGRRSRRSFPALRASAEEVLAVQIVQAHEKKASSS